MKTPIEIVNELNSVVADQTEETGLTLVPFEFGTNGNEDWIKFLGHPLWTSEDGSIEDMRENIEHELSSWIRSLSLIKIEPLMEQFTENV